MKLSIATVGKNDSYGGEKYIEKMVYCIHENKKLFEGFDFEYVLLDWASADKKLHEIDELSRLENVKHVYVCPSALEKQKLQVNRFYEYYAKNVVVRNCISEHLLLINSDILLTDDIANQIKLDVNNVRRNFFWRPKRRISFDFDTFFFTYECDSCTNAYDGTAGDFLFLERGSFIQVKGYDEVDLACRGKDKQSHMDISFNMRLLDGGVKGEVMDLKYYHIDHDRLDPNTKTISTYMGTSNAKYDNPDTWGMASHEKCVINENVVYIK